MDEHEGDAVTQGEPIAEVTTDKVNMEVEAPNGCFGRAEIQRGDTVPVTEVIAYVLKAGETVPTAVVDGGRKTEDRPPTTDDRSMVSSSPHRPQPFINFSPNPSDA